MLQPLRRRRAASAALGKEAAAGGGGRGGDLYGDGFAWAGVGSAAAPGAVVIVSLGASGIGSVATTTGSTVFGATLVIWVVGRSPGITAVGRSSSKSEIGATMATVGATTSSESSSKAAGMKGLPPVDDDGGP